MIDQIKIDFEKVIKNSNLSENDIKLKRKYLNNFIQNGFPSRKLENWKFSDLNQIIQKNIGELSFFNDNSRPNKVDTSIFIDGLEHNKIIFINGRIEKIDFSYEDQDKIAIDDDYKFENNIENSNSLLSLNNAFSNKCYKISIKEDYALIKPLVVYLSLIHI